MTHIIVFGDSIAQGFWDKKGGWVQRLRETCDEKMLGGYKGDLFVFNCGVSGDTIKDVLERFEVEAKARKSESGEDVIIFSIGSNDSEYVIKENKTRFSVEQFSKNIELLIKLAKKHSSKIIFTGLLPVDENKTTPIPWAPDRSYMNSHIKQFDEAIKKICKKKNILFVEVFDVFSRKEYKKLLEDGVHPNSAGHEIIYKEVYRFLVKNKIF